MQQVQQCSNNICVINFCFYGNTYFMLAYLSYNLSFQQGVCSQMATAGCVKLLCYICVFEYRQPHLNLGGGGKRDSSSSGPNFHCFCFTLLSPCFIFPEKYTSCIAWFHIFCFAFVSLSTTRGPKRQKLYVLHTMASVPYKLLFVYDAVCIGFPGITSA